ncbi:MULTISPECIES: MerR family transcriptional regulator [unclassified Mesorhizobium]|uniref:MerR family transcriptional regulator n=1 Tax=unclassified Mesorhizobium TaxID=325217 RepID=UPI000FD351E5|nr:MULTISPECIES: MerR family transcriptional regulator [unclassified Mesorhizobium]RUV27678.1 MerR family transcriptional regulator [Mesorhizobium sp. M5C.F.Ca.IN.020.32.2.1]RWD78299.1 MAG: MerR family transcriptional regulator [Mesorhizobium sp.]RWG48500.1 MAG: MerR family transcriptional regulator [Mesorhizobium sp.]RWH49996.1 MAG: MerR family transcriptional regulator [Mesorhizobium sp.]RWH57592.1 MAG: MerR family transcriptional regulator [Mesorhizobium sp.]
MIAATEKLFSAPQVCEAAGCKQVTLRAWRRRNGLFPETLTDRRQNHFFSLRDVCMVRAIVVLTHHGLAADDAIRFAQDPTFGLRIESYIDSFLKVGTHTEDNVVGFFMGDASKPGDRILDWDSGQIVDAADRPPAKLTFLFFGAGAEPLISCLSNPTGAVTFVNMKTIVKHIVNALAPSSGEPG